ncbi:metallophosphoesterase family protein [Bacillus sp. USDA818B3_A]|uniref:metallophosphoesterase family protein n=1 Tax=Bacillus sp. USDA818B3_A TaxID=2698834 RepID=UPI00136D3C59|nr:metallophosphoesterase family protein [Bacillus sp. USDA818B3_A]
MKILAISDTHGYYRNYPDISPDLVILLGDIKFYEIREIEKKYNCPIVGILGNHDAVDYYQDTNIIYAHHKIITVNGIKIAGFNGSIAYKRKQSLLYFEEEVYEFVKDLESVDIFIAHSNPATEETQELDAAHRGFVAFNYYIKTKQPKYFLHGHLHKANSYIIEKTNVISVYPFKIFDF